MNNDRTHQTTTKTNERDSHSGKQSQDDTRHAGGTQNPSKSAGTPKQDDDAKRMGGSGSDHAKHGRQDSK